MKAALSILLGILVASSAPPTLSDACQNAKSPPDKPNIAVHGVVAEFAVHSLEFTHADDVKIALKLTNITEKPVRFRYSCCIELHIDLRGADGKLVYWKTGAPIPECPYQEVEIKPGATVERKAVLPFGRFYSVKAGSYTMGFRYDLRLMSPVDAGKESWVPWSKSRIKVTVK